MSDALTAWLRAEIESDMGRARHILDVRGARPDPRREMYDAIADCEAKLGILDDYASTLAIVRDCEDRMRRGEECRTPRDYMDGKRELVVFESVIRQLASGYRHRDGYREEDWRP